MKKNARKNLSKKRLGCESLEDRRLLAVVTSAADSGAGSLRAALATGDPTITFDTAAMGGNVITLTSGQLDVANAVSIDGGSGVTIDAGGSSRVMYIDDTLASYANVELSNLTITGGAAAEGAGIQSFENLTLTNVVVDNNRAEGSGADAGGLGHGNESRFAGTLTITGSSFTNNFAEDDAAAIDFYNAVDFTMTDTDIKNNISGIKANGDNAGAKVGAVRIIDLIDPQINGTTVVVWDNVDLSDNRVEGTAQPGGLLNPGGGAATATAALTVTNAFVPGNVMDVTIQNSTFSGNVHDLTDTDTSDDYAADGDGGAAGFTDVDQLTITDTTFTSNYAYGNAPALEVGVADVPSKVTLSGLTITGNGDGSVIGGTGKSGAGGGIWLIDFVVDDDDDPNTPYVDGLGSLDVDLTDVTISGNTAFNGAGLMVQSQQGRATVDILRSTFDGNIANNGAIPDANGVQPEDPGWIPTYSGVGGGIWVPGRVDMTITDSTISNNDAGFEGGGIEVDSGVTGDPSTLTLINSTVSGNSVEFEDQTGTTPAFDVYIGGGGGIWTDNGVMTTLIQSTVTGNSAPQGGGIKLAGYNSSYGRDYLDLQGSIVSGNSATSVLMPAAGFVAGDDIFDVDGSYTYSYYDAVTASFSIIGNADGTALTESQTPDANGNLIGSAAGGGAIDAMLGALADNGGSTLTHLPMAGSPAIDAGDPAFSGSATDQRGASRVVGAAVDIGSVEVGGVVTASCDFSGDGMCDCEDVGALTAEVASGANNSAFDLTGDGLVNLADRDQWLADAGAMNNTSGGAYLLGDINLDGFVDVSDRNIWNQNKFTATPEWCSGDVNMDGFIDVSDLNIWNTFKFMSSDSAATLTIDVKPGVTADTLGSSAFEVAAAKPSAELPVSEIARVRGTLVNSDLSSADDQSEEEASVVDSVFADFDTL